MRRLSIVGFLLLGASLVDALHGALHCRPAIAASRCIVTMGRAEKCVLIPSACCGWLLA